MSQQQVVGIMHCGQFMLDMPWIEEGWKEILEVR